MTNFAGRSKPGVIAAPPVLMGETLSQAACSFAGPAALKIAPQTPPPIARSVLAALTIASTFIRVMSCRTIVKGIVSPPSFHKCISDCIKLTSNFCKFAVQIQRFYTDTVAAHHVCVIRLDFFIRLSIEQQS